MNIGLIDVDGHNFPNLALMKLSAYHKRQGDSVTWYEPLFQGYPKKPLDKVYMSKIFSFTPDYNEFINAKEIVKGGSGYCIETINGKEVYHTEKDRNLDEDIEHIYPDYSLYPELTKDTAYGYLSRGCPRGCNFCHVAAKEGKTAYKVANLKEFWNGQKNIVLLDPNLTACKEYDDLLNQLINSKSYVNFSQGLDIRLMTERKIELLKQIKIKSIHFAWDKIEDRNKIVEKFKMFKDLTKWGKEKTIVYVLTNFDTTIEQDLDRIYTLRDLGYNPYIMIYNKEFTTPQDEVRKLQRWCNNRRIFNTVKNFKDYEP